MRKTRTTFAAAALSIMVAASGASAALTAVGPVNREVPFTPGGEPFITGPAGFDPTYPLGYPLWYEDANGIRLTITFPPQGISAPADPLDPNSVALNTGGETFYWSASAAIPDWAGAGFNAAVEFAMEGTFGGAEAIIDGQQITFTRLRIRIDTPEAGTYTVIHPYGSQVFNVAVAADGINFTTDIGGVPNPSDPNPDSVFNEALFHPVVGPNFLTWDTFNPNPALNDLLLQAPNPANPALPFQLVGRMNIPHAIAPGPFGAVFTVEGPTQQTTATTNLWDVTGQVFSQLGSSSDFLPFYRSYNSTHTDHFYTTKTVDRDALAENNYIFEKIEGYISGIPSAGFVPLHQLYNATSNSHYYTTSDAEKTSVLNNSDWVDQGVAGYVHPVPVDNHVPMYHLYSSTDDDHFYTISEFERDYAVANYGYENQGVAFYVARNGLDAALAGDPVATAGGVNLYSGNFVPFHNHVDLANPEGVGLPFVFARTYNSQNVSESGPLGPGWNHSYNIRIEAFGGQAIVKWGDGRDDHYTISGTDYVHPPGVYNKLEKTPGSYLLTTKDNTVYTFVETVVDDVSIGRLVEIRNKNGVDLDILHDPAKQGVIAKITDGAGRVYNFHYAGTFGTLSPSNRYRLTSIIEENAGGLTRTLTFGYDDQGRLASSTDPENNTTTYNYEDATNAYLLTKITLPRGNTIQAIYSGERVSGITLVGADSGVDKEIAVTYDKQFSTGAIGTEFVGKSTNGPDQVIGAVHNGGSAPILTQMYDGLNNMAEIKEWDANFKPTHILDKNGEPWWYEYDQRTGNITKAQNPYMQTVTMGYDLDDARANNLLSITDAEGNATLFEYADGKNLSRIIQVSAGSPTTNITRYPNGMVQVITGPANNAAGTVGTITYTYDSYGYLTTATDALGNVSTTAYDAGGRLLSKEDGDHVTATYSYDLLGHVETITDMLNRATTLEYDSNGNLTKVTDPRSIVTQYVYTDLDLVDSITTAGNRTVKYGYDGVGRKNQVINAADRAWSVSYDEAGRIVSGQTPLGNTETFNEYDANGKLKRHTDRRGSETTFSYDNAGRLIAKSISSGSLYGYTYNANGKLLSISRNNIGIGQFQYDAANRLISSKDPYEKTVGYAYYPGGNLKEITYPDGKKVTYDYDVRNLLISVKDWMARTITYDYTPGGRLLKITYPNGASVEYSYDAAFRTQKVTNKQANGTVIAEYVVDEFDPLDAPLQMTTTGGIDAPVAAMAETSTYDDDNRLVTIGNATLTYNNQGEVLTKTDGTQETIYTWNAGDTAGQLQSVSINSNTKRYEYDGFGNRVSRTAAGATTHYVLDLSGAMANVLMETDHAGSPKTYFIHGLGVAARILLNGSAQYYHFDRQGNVVALTNDTGNIADEYSYATDPFGFAVVHQGTTNNPFTFVGRYGVMDEGDDQFYMRARYYDARVGRFLNEDPIGFAGGDVNLYAYVGGNPMVGIDPTGFNGELTVTINEQGQIVQQPKDVSSKISDDKSTIEIEPPSESTPTCTDDARKELNSLGFWIEEGVTYVVEKATHVPLLGVIYGLFKPRPTGGSATISEQFDDGLYEPSQPLNPNFEHNLNLNPPETSTGNSTPEQIVSGKQDVK